MEKSTIYFCNKVANKPNKLVIKLFKTFDSAGVSVPIFSRQTGIPKDRVYKWRQEGTNPKADDEKIILAWISEVEKVPHETLHAVHERDFAPDYSRKKTIPFYDAPASAGLTETDMSPIHAPSGTIDVGDLLHDSQAAIRIYGNSMLPNYPPGCVIGLVKCTKDFIEPGEVYVIETRDRRLLKRLFYKNDDTDGDLIICYSDNIMKFEGGARDGKLAYPPFELPKKEIINLFVVTGVIKRNTNSVIINR